MLVSTKIAIGSAVIASGAFGVSLASLWKTHFSKFNSVAATGKLTHRIYPIKSEDRRWFISSFGLPITITNDGARTGNIIGLRLIFHYPDIPIPGNKETVNPVFEIKPSDARKIDQERFEWLDKLVIGEWMPFTILPRQSITKHLIFETRWDYPVVQNRIKAHLEILSNKSKNWKQINEWDLYLDAASWGELANRGTSCSYTPKGFQQQSYAECKPDDLHKYTGSKEEIPTDGYNAAPSYLCFPENEK